MLGSLSMKWLVVDPKERTARWTKTDNGDENLYCKRYRLECAMRYEVYQNLLLVA